MMSINLCHLVTHIQKFKCIIIGLGNCQLLPGVYLNIFGVCGGGGGGEGVEGWGGGAEADRVNF